MVSALDSRVRGPGPSPGRGHCVVFLGKTNYSHMSHVYFSFFNLLKVTGKLEIEHSG